jgi:hypothetical protein
LAAISLDGPDPAALAAFWRPGPRCRQGRFQPSPDVWRVLLAPAGHPFCITTLIPAE